MSMANRLDAQAKAYDVQRAEKTSRDEAIEEVRTWLYMRRGMAVSDMYRRVAAEYIRDFNQRFPDPNAAEAGGDER